MLYLFGCIIIGGCILMASESHNDDINKSIANNTTVNITNNTTNISEDTPVQPVKQEQKTSISSSNHKSSLNYDPELNLYYNSECIVVNPDGEHPQGEGLSYDYLATHNCGEE